MANFYQDNEDLKFYMEQWIDWDPLVELTEYKYRAEDCFTSGEEAKTFYADILDMIGKFAANEIAPLGRELDQNHPWIENGVVKCPEAHDKIFSQIKDLGIHGMCVSRELGGMNCPFVLFMLSAELMARADVSVAAHHGFHGGMAMALLFYSFREGSMALDVENACIAGTRFQEVIAEIIQGEAWCSMDITEPGAGSDMAAINTKGEQDEEGNWFLTGQKIFITSGHAKYHIVIARTEDRKSSGAFSGLKGLSLFLVQAWTLNEAGERIQLASFTKVEEKLGHHGSATVSINYDRTPAQLIGKRGEGFKQMLLIMNNARVGVGFEALGLSEAAFRLARDYATERPSMGKTIDQQEMIADMLDEMHTDIQGIRALAVEGAYEEEMAHKLEISAQLLPPETAADREKHDAEVKRHQKRSRAITPLVKYLAAERAVVIAQRCIQIHGGYGYSTEYDAERLLRDALVLPIYEGTSQIQALMAMKDNLMGVLAAPRAFAERYAHALWKGTFRINRGERRVNKMRFQCCKAIGTLMLRVTAGKLRKTFKQPPGQWWKGLKRWDPSKDFSVAMLHAARLTEMLARTTVVEILLKQSQKFPQREELLIRALEYSESRCVCLYREIRRTGNRLIKTLE